MPAQSPIFLYTILDLHWGYTVRQPGATAAQSAYVLPPPTTVVGAFANPLARILGVPDYVERRLLVRLPVQNRFMKCLLGATLAAGAGLLPARSPAIGAATYEEPSRIMGTPYKGGGDYREAVRKPAYLSATTLLPVQAVGAASAPGALLALAWLVNVDVLSDCVSERVDIDMLDEACIGWGAARAWPVR